MEIVFMPSAQKDLKYWKRTKNIEVMQRISILLTDIEQHPDQGLGNPEILKYSLSGFWSRRINKEHRLVYRVIDDCVVEVISLRFHY